MFRPLRMFLDGGAGSTGDPGGEGDKSAGSGGDPPALPDTVEAWQEFHKTTIAAHETVVSEHKTKVEELETANAGHLTKLGKQGNELGTLRTLKDKIASDPASYIQELATEHKLKVTFGEAGAMTMTQILTKQAAGELEPAKAAELIEGLVEGQIAQGVSVRLSVGEKSRVEDYLRTKYKDYDDLEGDRGVLSAQLTAKGMTHHELLHLAVQGQNLPEALKAFRKEVEQETIDTIWAKAKAGQATPEGEGGAGSEGAKSEPPKVADIITQMQANMGR